jgi:hypothetical protein
MEILEGDLGELVDALASAEQARQLGPGGNEPESSAGNGVRR